MGGAGEPHSHSLFSLRSQHQIQSDVSSQNSMGADQGREHVHLGVGARLKRMKEKKRIPTDGEPPQWGSPFEVLKKLDVPAPPASEATTDRKVSLQAAAKKNRGRVDILRST